MFGCRHFYPFWFPISLLVHCTISRYPGSPGFVWTEGSETQADSEQYKVSLLGEFCLSPAGKHGLVGVLLLQSVPTKPFSTSMLSAGGHLSSLEARNGKGLLHLHSGDAWLPNSLRAWIWIVSHNPLCKILDFQKRNAGSYRRPRSVYWWGIHSQAFPQENCGTLFPVSSSAS